MPYAPPEFESISYDSRIRTSTPNQSNNLRILKTLLSTKYTPLSFVFQVGFERAFKSSFSLLTKMQQRA